MDPVRYPHKKRRRHARTSQGMNRIVEFGCAFVIEKDALA